MVKKASFIFAIFYLLNAIGYGIEVHYCLGQVADVNYAFFETSCACDDVHEKASVSCCDDESYFIQLEDEHQQAGKLSVQVLPSEIKDVNTTFSTAEASTSHSGSSLLRAPPKPLDRLAFYQQRTFYS